jgi:thioesterase domain-containing protein
LQAALTAIGLMFLFGCSATRSGLATSESAPPASARSPAANVVIVRGTVGYWPDCESFVSRLKGQGAQATVIRGREVNRTAERIAQTRASGNQAQPLILLGYSRGANDAIRLTRRLQERGVAVDTLILMETAAQDSVPANVASCLNVYKSSSVAEEWVPAFRGLPVTVESANTQLVNYNLRFHDEGAEGNVIERFTVCQNAAVQAMIAERVALALRSPEVTAAAPDAEVAGGPWGDGATTRREFAE